MTYKLTVRTSGRLVDSFGFWAKDEAAAAGVLARYRAYHGPAARVDLVKLAGDGAMAL